MRARILLVNCSAVGSLDQGTLNTGAWRDTDRTMSGDGREDRCQVEAVGPARSEWVTELISAAISLPHCLTARDCPRLPATARRNAPQELRPNSTPAPCSAEAGCTLISYLQRRALWRPVADHFIQTARVSMARVTRSSKTKEVTEPVTTAAAAPPSPKRQVADIPIRSIENHDAPPQEATEPEQAAGAQPSKKPRDRRKEYQRKRRAKWIAAIKASGKTPAEKDALTAGIYKPFRTKAANDKRVELEQLAQAQQDEITELKKQLANKEASETGTPRATC